jgi:hypothetical protein
VLHTCVLRASSILNPIFNTHHSGGLQIRSSLTSRCVDIHIFRPSQVCVASAVGSTPTQYDLGASQCSVCEDRPQNSGQRVEDFYVGVLLSLTFNIIATPAHPILICLVQVRHRGLVTATAATAQSSLQTPALGKSPKHTHRQVMACDSCV